MGYTHYFQLHKSNPESFKYAVDLFKELMPKFPQKSNYGDYPILPLYDGYGEKEEPIITDTEVCFNGNANDGLDHETFHISLKDNDWNFCKTARKPYDFAVCVMLLCLAVFHDKSEFSFSSDGDMRKGEEWEFVMKWWFQNTKRKFNFPPYVYDVLVGRMEKVNFDEELVKKLQIACLI